jgi:hypothetical protein
MEDYLLPLLQPEPATLTDFIKAIHSFEMMRAREIHHSAGLVGDE